MNELYLVQIQTTSVCNARCKFCPYKDSWMIDNTGVMDMKLYEKILRDINDYNPNFSGKFCPYLMNEPFADRHLVERVKLAYDILEDPFIAISTNGELISDKVTNDLYKVFEDNNFRGKIGFTHYGINKETIEEDMKIDYDKSLKNILNTIKKFETKIKMSVSTNTYSIDNKNYTRNDRIVVRYWTKLLESADINPNNVVIIPKVYHNRAGNVHSDDWEYNRIVRKIDARHPLKCKRINESLHVLWNGEVVPCCMDYFHEHVLGNLNEQTVKDLFNSIEYKEFADMVSGKKESPDNFICNRCQSPGG